MAFSFKLGFGEYFSFSLSCNVRLESCPAPSSDIGMSVDKKQPQASRIPHWTVACLSMVHTNIRLQQSRPTRKSDSPPLPVSEPIVNAQGSKPHGTKSRDGRTSDAGNHDPTTEEGENALHRLLQQQVVVDSARIVANQHNVRDPTRPCSFEVSSYSHGRRAIVLQSHALI